MKSENESEKEIKRTAEGGGDGLRSFQPRSPKLTTKLVLFKLIDTNGDGKISASELSDVIICLGSNTKNKGLAEKEAEGIVRALDFNGDGFVGFDKFMMVVTKEEDEEEDDDDEDGELKDAFMIYDSDRNDLLSAKEMRRVMVNLGWRDCGIRDCKNMIQAVDLNGDGFVVSINGEV